MPEMSRRYFLEAAGAVAVAPALDIAAAQGTAAAPSIAVEKDVVFGKGGTLNPKPTPTA